MNEFSDGVALVTGAAGGIGRAVARSLASRGAMVVLADVRPCNLDSLLDEIREDGGKAVGVGGDVSVDSDVANMVRLAAKYGALKWAVNNAGINGRRVNLAEYPKEIWDSVIGVNLTGVLNGLRHQIPEMLRTGGGAVVNVSSVAGLVSSPGSAAYIASKHGVIGLTKSAAVEYGDAGIRVNAVAPGYVVTPLLEANNTKEQLREVANKHALRRLARPHEVANVITFLLSESASFVTGTCVPVDGGFLAA